MTYEGADNPDKMAEAELEQRRPFWTAGAVQALDELAKLCGVDAPVIDTEGDNNYKATLKRCAQAVRDLKEEVSVGHKEILEADARIEAFENAAWDRSTRHEE